MPRPLGHRCKPGEFFASPGWTGCCCLFHRTVSTASILSQGLHPGSHVCIVLGVAFLSQLCLDSLGSSFPTGFTPDSLTQYSGPSLPNLVHVQYATHLPAVSPADFLVIYYGETYQIILSTQPCCVAVPLSSWNCLLASVLLSGLSASSYSALRT